MRALSPRARWLLLGVALTLALLANLPRLRAQEGAPAQTPPTVGMPGRLTEVVLPGSELEVRAKAAKDPLVLRITRVSPHGTAFRYDFEYVGLEPGKYDLRDALRRRDGTPLVVEGNAEASLPPIPVEIASVLPAGSLMPHAPPGGSVPRFGGYRVLQILGAIVWIAGLCVILFGWRRRRLALAAANYKPRTLAERLRPLVEHALAGRLSREQRAQLELGLIAYWRRKLGLEHERPAHMLEMLRKHSEAGPLINSLEAWLHMPAPPEKVDLEALLAPYRNLPADELPEFEPAQPALSAKR